MLRTDEEKRICEEYGKDEYGRIRCEGCPLKARGYDKMCKAIGHYNISIGEWVFD